MFELLPVWLQYVAAYATLAVLLAGVTAGTVYLFRLIRNYRAADKQAIDTH